MRFPGKASHNIFFFLESGNIKFQKPYPETVFPLGKAAGLEVDGMGWEPSGQEEAGEEAVPGLLSLSFELSIRGVCAYPACVWPTAK